MLHKRPSSLPTRKLTEAEKMMYASEKLMNFRWISKLLAKRSRRVLTTQDLATVDVENELAELGQFAEVASRRGELPVRWLFENITALLQTDFPLEGYDSLQGCTLVSEYVGDVAHLHGFTAYRPQTKQLIVAFSGTTDVAQALRDVQTHMHVLRSGEGAAHAGFWNIYKGIRGASRKALEKGLQEHDVAEVVITGHSLGGAVSNLFTLDLLAERVPLPEGMRLKLAAFGAPRSGNEKLCRNWQELVKGYRAKHGDDSFTEYSVKAYNDGVPSLPPLSFGFRHFTKKPLYYCGGHLYHIPEEYCEDALFDVDGPKSDSEDSLLPFPKGGHNYYNGRDMEKVARRILWLDEVMAGTADWETRYKEYLAKHSNQ